MIEREVIHKKCEWSSCGLKQKKGIESDQLPVEVVRVSSIWEENYGKRLATATWQKGRWWWWW
jgi:hypothetical protein